MQHNMLTAAVLLMMILALAGCESNQQKSARLQAAYDAAAKQYATDCPSLASKGASAYFSSRRRSAKSDHNRGATEREVR